MEAQQPIIAIGTTLDVSGHKAVVLRVEHGGVRIRLTNPYHQGREVLVDFRTIENAIG
jgi:hypothetical protein